MVARTCLRSLPRGIESVLYMRCPIWSMVNLYFEPEYVTLYTESAPVDDVVCRYLFIVPRLKADMAVSL